MEHPVMGVDDVDAGPGDGPLGQNGEAGRPETPGEEDDGDVMKADRSGVFIRPAAVGEDVDFQGGIDRQPFRQGGGEAFGPAHQAVLGDDDGDPPGSQYTFLTFGSLVPGVVSIFHLKMCSYMVEFLNQLISSPSRG